MAIGQIIGQSDNLFTSRFDVYFSLGVSLRTSLLYRQAQDFSLRPCCDLPLIAASPAPTFGAPWTEQPRF
ncbi:MAG: hypothetical protein NTW45_00730, partial [Rhodocyclales bacterium]|nr:hypothetical protein [Rhodocyclales bacterium]